MFNRFAVILVLCCCLMAAAMARAADVALVTEKTGTVQASLAGDEWNVELAEILPDGVEIKVSEDGSLVLVHLPTNQEYRFAPQASAKLTLAAVTGEKFTASATELVSADLNLSQSMSNQTGAVEPGRVNVAVQSAPPPPPVMAPAAPAPAPAPVSSDEMMEERKAGPRGSMMPQEEMKDSSSVDNNLEAAREVAISNSFKAKSASIAPKSLKEEFDSESPGAAPEIDAAADQEAGTDAGIAAAGSSENAAVLAGAAPDVPVSRLAFPAEVFAKFCSDETGLKVKTDKYLVSRVNYPADGWVEVEIEGAENFAETLNLEGNLATFSVDVVVVGAILIIDAWKLEKSGKLYQAAAMWLALQKSGLAPEKVAPNLKRLKEAILKVNK